MVNKKKDDKKLTKDQATKKVGQLSANQECPPSRQWSLTAVHPSTCAAKHWCLGNQLKPVPVGVVSRSKRLHQSLRGLGRALPHASADALLPSSSSHTNQVPAQVNADCCRWDETPEFLSSTPYRLLVLEAANATQVRHAASCFSLLLLCNKSATDRLEQAS